MIVVDAVIHHVRLFRVHAVAPDADRLREVRDADYAGRGVHAATLDVVQPLINVLAGAVELGGVDVDDERAAGDGGEGDARGEGHPVVGVDAVKALVAGQGDAQPGVALGVGEHVAVVAAAAPAALGEAGSGAHRGGDGVEIVRAAEEMGGRVADFPASASRADARKPEHAMGRSEGAIGG